MTIVQRQGDMRAKVGWYTMQYHIQQQAALSKSFLMYLQNLLVIWMLRINEFISSTKLGIRSMAHPTLQYSLQKSTWRLNELACASKGVEEDPFIWSKHVSDHFPRRNLLHSH